MGVLDWAEELQRQKEAQREAEINQKANEIERFAQESRDSDTSEEMAPWVADSAKGNNQPSAFGSHPEHQSGKTWINPLHAGLSNNILEPTPINKVSDDEKSKQESTKQPIDITLFDKEDDIFDNIERQTIDVLDELKTVFQSSTPENVDINQVDTKVFEQTEETTNDNGNQNLNVSTNCNVQKTVVCDIDNPQRNNCEYSGQCAENGLQSQEDNSTHEDTVDAGEYVDLYQGNQADNVQDIKIPEQIKAYTPLPPISSNSAPNMASDSKTSETPAVNSADQNGKVDSPGGKPLEYENVSIPNTFSGVKYSHHRMSPEPHSYVNMPSFQRNGFTDHLSNVIRNTRSTPDLPHYVSRENKIEVSLCPEDLSNAPPKPSNQQVG